MKCSVVVWLTRLGTLVGFDFFQLPGIRIEAIGAPPHFEWAIAAI